MNMVKEGNVITLRLNTIDTLVELPVYLTFSATEGFIPIVVEFYIRPYRLEAKISLDENLQNRIGEIKLPFALSGEGRISLGGVVSKSTSDKFILNKSNPDKSVPENSPLKIIDSAVAISAPATVETFSDTVWDELAILFSAVPLLPEALPETAAEEEAANPPLPLADTNADNSIQEQETQEREAQERMAPVVLSENF